MVGPAAKREAVAQLRTLFEMSERRATTLVGADRATIRYRSRRPDEAALRARLRDLCDVFGRVGISRRSAVKTKDACVPVRWIASQRRSIRKPCNEMIGLP